MSMCVCVCECVSNLPGSPTTSTTMISSPTHTLSLTVPRGRVLSHRCSNSGRAHNGRRENEGEEITGPRINSRHVEWPLSMPRTSTGHREKGAYHFATTVFPCRLRRCRDWRRVQHRIRRRWRRPGRGRSAVAPEAIETTLDNMDLSETRCSR